MCFLRDCKSLSRVSLDGLCIGGYDGRETEGIPSEE